MSPSAILIVLAIETTSIIFIILGSIPFISYIKFLNGNKKIFFSDTQIKSFVKIIIISTLVLFIYLTTAR